jgi:hypothetical protein
MTRSVVLFAVVPAVLLALLPSRPSDTAGGARRAAESSDGSASGSEVDARSSDVDRLEPDAEFSPDASLLAVPARTGRVSAESPRPSRTALTSW